MWARPAGARSHVCYLVVNLSDRICPYFLIGCNAFCLQNFSHSSLKVTDSVSVCVLRSVQAMILEKCKPNLQDICCVLEADGESVLERRTAGDEANGEDLERSRVCDSALVGNRLWQSALCQLVQIEALCDGLLVEENDFDHDLYCCCSCDCEGSRQSAIC